MQSVPITTNVVSSNPVQARCNRYIMWWSLSVTSGRSVVFSGFSPSTKKNWPPWYNWNIVESGVKHHKPTNQTYIMFVNSIKISYIFITTHITSYIIIMQFNCTVNAFFYNNVLMPFITCTSTKYTLNTCSTWPSLLLTIFSTFKSSPAKLLKQMEPMFACWMVLERRRFRFLQVNLIINEKGLIEGGG